MAINGDVKTGFLIGLGWAFAFALLGLIQMQAMKVAHRGG